MDANFVVQREFQGSIPADGASNIENEYGFPLDGEALHQLDPAPAPGSTTLRAQTRCVGTPALRAAAEGKRKHDWKYMCLFDGCGGGFTNRKNARIHARAHFSVKFHICSCGSSFTTNSDLNKHLANSKHVLTEGGKAEIEKSSRLCLKAFDDLIKEIKSLG